MKIFIPVVDFRDSPWSRETAATVATYGVLADQQKEQIKIVKEAIPQAKITKELRLKYSREKRAKGIVHQPYAHFFAAPPVRIGVPEVKTQEDLPQWAAALKDTIHFNAALALASGLRKKDESVEPILFSHGARVAHYLADLDDQMLPNVVKINLPASQQDKLTAKELPVFPEDSPLYNYEENQIIAVSLPRFDAQSDSDKAAAQLFQLIKKHHSKRPPNVQIVLVKHTKTSDATLGLMHQLLFSADLGEFPVIDDANPEDILSAVTANRYSVLLTANDHDDMTDAAIKILPSNKIVTLDMSDEPRKYMTTQFYYDAGLITRINAEGKQEEPGMRYPDAPVEAAIAYALIDTLVPVF